MSTSQDQTPLIISKNIASIISYYEEEHILHHKSIVLHSFVTNEQFHETLIKIQAEFPDVEMKYAELKKGTNSLCHNDNDDLSILIPSKILTSKVGRFQYKKLFKNRMMILL